MIVKQTLRERILTEIEKLPERQLQEVLGFAENLLNREKEVQLLRTQNEEDSFYNQLIRFTGNMSHNSILRNIGKKPPTFLRIILIADEDYRIRNLVRLMFTESRGYIVADTSSGADAILKAKMIKPDIILAGVSLPDKNGYDISKEIKNDLLLKNSPVILLTSAFDAFNEKKVLESRADDIVAKPFEPEEMIKKVEFLLSQSREKEIRSDLGLQAEKSYGEEIPVLFKAFSEGVGGLGKYMDSGMLNPIRLSIAQEFRKFYQLQKASVEGFKTTIRRLKGRQFRSNKTLNIIRHSRASSPPLDIRPSFAQLVFFILSMGLGMVLLITAFFGFTSYKEMAIFVQGTEKEVSFLEAKDNRYDKSMDLGLEESRVKGVENRPFKLKPKLRRRVKRENYIIKEGDTLWRISRRFNIPVKDLKAINKLEDDKIYAGDVVTIPLLRTR